ncbi:MAG: hypothetical protein HC912_05200 [Saprospiraceae bacterium]|nr:hypothetical protein [Saprospiraceae bacterium]
MTTLPKLRIDIVSDVVCPWCYVGRKRMAKALAQIETPHELEIHWRPFELNGQLPATGLPFRPYMLQKFGSESQLNAMFAHMTNVGETEGIDFRFDLVAYAPNTFEAHAYFGGQPLKGSKNYWPKRYLRHTLLRGRMWVTVIPLLLLPTRLG